MKKNGIYINIYVKSAIASGWEGGGGRGEEGVSRR